MPRSTAARRFIPVAVRSMAVRMSVHQLEDRTQPGDILLGGLLMQGVSGGGAFPAEASPLTRWLPESLARPSAASDEWVPLADPPAPRWATQPATEAPPAAEYQPAQPSWLSSGVFAWVGQSAPAVTAVSPLAPVVAPPELMAVPSSAVRFRPSADAPTPPAIVGADNTASASMWNRVSVAAPTAADEVSVAAGSAATTAAGTSSTTSNAAKAVATDADAAKTTHYYLADGQAVGMNVHPNRVALGTAEANRVLDLPGLTYVRPVNQNVAVYEATGAGTPAAREAFAAQPGVTLAVPVFSLPETQSEAVLLREVIVALKPGVTAESFFVGNPQFVGYRPLLGTPDQFVGTTAGYGEDALDVSNTLPADPRVAWAAPDFYQTWQKHYTPNDPRFTNQWHLNNTGQGGGLVDADVDMPEAWDVNQGGSADVVIAVVDDGVGDLPSLLGGINHPDLNGFDTGDIYANGADDNNNGWLDDANGYNFVANNAFWWNTNATDLHGTAVAGVAAARGDNALGVAGAAYKSRVLSVRIFEGASVASDANIASALYYAAGRTANGLGTWRAGDVVNNSWGGGAASTAINTALTWGTTLGRQGKGAAFFFSAGNGGGAALSQPAIQSGSIPGVIAVGATNFLGVRSGYSQYGPELDVVTPSDNFTPTTHLAIDTTDRQGAEGYNTTAGTAGDYTGTGAAGFGGTSSASPLAAGIGALVLAHAEALGVTLTPAQLRAHLRNNTDLIAGATYSATTGRATEYGYGRLNAFNAVRGVNRPEISVLSTTADLTSGSAVANLGSAIIGQPVDVTFRVRNQGTSALNLGTLSVAAGPFSIQSGLGSTSLAVGASTTFTVRFSPTTGGVVDRTLTLLSNDADEGTFTFTLRGTGLVPNISGTVHEDWDGDGARDPNDPGLAGRAVYLDANDNGAYDSGTQTFVANSLAVPDTNTAVFSDLTVSGLGTAIADVNVTVNLRHTNDADLDVFLVAPDGTRVELFTDVGGTGDNFTSTVLDDQAATAITAGTAPFSGSFRPEGLLSAFNGMAAATANGVWRLEATDDATGETGFIDSWSLSFATGTQTFNNTTPVNILDVATVTSTLAVSGGPTTITDVNVRINLTHTWDSDLNIFLISPAGTRVELSTGNGGSGDNYTNTVFDDEAGTAVTAGTAPFTGSFRPEGLLSAVDGQGANGNWVIEITDTAGGDVGVLTDWDLIVTGGVTAATPVPTPIPDTATAIFSDLPVSGFNAPITDVNVTVNLRHTNDADLDVFLVAPDGTRVELFTDVGGTGDNFTNTVLDDQATTAITATTAVAPFTGTFQPEGLLSAFNGRAANGVWRLEVTDDTTGGTGFIDGWRVTIATAEQQTATATGGAYAFLNLPPATYVVRQIMPAGWTGTVPSRTVTVTDPNNQNPGQDFGSSRNGRVYTHAFVDANGNGVRDAGEGPASPRTIFVDGNQNGVIDSGTLTTVSSGAISVALPDNSTVTRTLAVSGLAGNVADMNVRVNMTHTWDGDVRLVLISPSGTRVPLVTNRGGSGDNFVNTVFDDEAATSVTTGTAPFTGSFRPESPLSAVDGQAANGTWTLEMQDTASGDTGLLTEFALIILHGNPEPSANTDALGNAFFDGVAAGTQHVRMTSLGGWAHTVPADGKHVVTVSAVTPNHQVTFGTVQPVAPTAPAVLVNGTDAPSAAVTRSMVQSLVLTFNTPISGVQDGAFSLTNGTNTITNTAGGGITAAVSGLTVTLTFTAVPGVDAGSLSLADGVWELTTDLTKVLNLFATGGTGTATQNDIRRLFGDVNSDGTVNLDDYEQFGAAFGLSTGDAGYTALLDANADGTINLDDYEQFGTRFGQSL
jgi:subtilisin-like proprotein convertase family protein/subtilisin family serine protease